jgi:hypothetical protein
MPHDPDCPVQPPLADDLDTAGPANLASHPVATSDPTEGRAMPTAAELLIGIGSSASALAQIGLTGVRTRLAGLVPRTHSKELLRTVTTGLDTAVTVGKAVTRKAGGVIKETAQDPETQELVFKGATVAAREVGLMVGGSIGGRIVERISEKLGARLLHGRVAEGEQPAQAEAARDETDDRTG